MVTVTDATAEQLPLIGDLARRIWPKAFGAIISQKQIAYMLEWMYSLPALEQQVAEGHRFLLVSAGAGFVGYAAYQVPPEADSVKLHKLYVLDTARGQGAGVALIDEVKQRALALGRSRLLLNVNRLNAAVTFYRKLGFRILKEQDNNIGGGYFMNDYVMELHL